MFTSRAEYRLLLREDNADLRLSEQGHRLGLLDEAQWRAFNAKRDALERERQRLRDCWVRPGDAAATAFADRFGTPLTREARAASLLQRPEVEYADLCALPGIGPGVTDPKVAEQLEIQAKYAGYIERQQAEIERQRARETQGIDPALDYGEVRGLSSEVREKLAAVRPATIGQAGRIPGVTPAAISLLLVHLKRRAG